LTSDRFKARLYLSMVDPDDTGARVVDNTGVADGDGEPLVINYVVPLEARDRLTEPCSQCSKSHEILWIIKRRPAGVLGHFPIFRINGSEVLVDASLPTGVLALPRDAKRLSPEKAAKLWHSTSELHEFGAGVDD